MARVEYCHFFLVEFSAEIPVSMFIADICWLSDDNCTCHLTFKSSGLQRGVGVPLGVHEDVLRSTRKLVTEYVELKICIFIIM
jgi:hypothetical protein